MLAIWYFDVLVDGAFLVHRLAESDEKLPRKLSPDEASQSCTDEEVAGGYIDEVRDSHCCTIGLP